MLAARVLAPALMAGALLASPAAAQSPTPTTTTSTAKQPDSGDEAGGIAPSTEPAAPPGTFDLGSEDSGDGDGGFFNVGGRVRKALNDWFKSIVEEGIAPTLDAISDYAVRTPDFTRSTRVRDLWRVSWGVANSVYVLAILAAGLLLITHETLQTSYTVKELAPRLIVGWIAANASVGIASLGIGFANGASAAFVAAPMRGASKPLSQMATAPLEHGGIFIILLAFVVMVLGVVLLCVCLLRMFTVATLIIAAPLMLAAHALPGTQGMARLWWRAFGGCLGVQVAQALAFGAAVRVFFNTDGQRDTFLPGGASIDMVLIICLLWLLIRLPSYAGRMVFNAQPSGVISTVKHLVVYRAVGGIVPQIHGRRRGRARGRR